MIRLAEGNDASGIALLHKETLATGFLAKLGVGFLRSLYVFLSQKELVIVYVNDYSTPAGFVSFSSDSSRMMKRFLISCPLCIIKIIGIVISTPAYIKRITETFTAPFKSKTTQTKMGKVDLPCAELLSISVDPTSQKTGIGSQLLLALEDHLRENDIKKYKVIAGAELESANNFYKKNGFLLVAQVIIHGNELSNIYIKEL